MADCMCRKGLAAETARSPLCRGSRSRGLRAQILASKNLGPETAVTSYVILCNLQGHQVIKKNRDKIISSMQELTGKDASQL